MTILNTLLEMTIYSAVLFGAIELFRWALKKHLSAAMLYAAWFLLIARLLMPVTLNSGVSLFVIPTEETQAAQTENVDVAELLGGLDNTIVSHNAPAADTASSPDTAAQTDTAAAETPLSALAAAVQFDVSWETVLTVVWLLGVAAMLMQILIAQMRLRRRLKRGQPVPAEWQAMADTLMHALGLRRKVRVVMIAGFPSPALVAGLRPVVVLPEEMKGKDDAAVRFALLHELTHIRRCDHIVSLLLLILRAVHWFNPVVWLTARQMRLDMETACDSQLTRPMDTAEKKQYAGTMLAMYANKQVRYVLGMAMGQTKKTAQRRLRGMFMRGKTTRRGRAAALMMAAVMLVACFTTACQPTPEEQIVVGKDQDAMIDAAQETPEAEQVASVAEQVAAPETYATDVSATDGKLTVSADGAAIVLPDTDSMSIMRVTAADFTQAQVDGLISALFDGQTIYEVTYGADTQDEIMQQIVYTKQLKTSDEYSSEGDQQQLDERIAWLQQQYDAAPETSEDIIVESDGQLKKKELTDYETGAHIAFYTGLNVTTNPEDYTQAASFGVENNNDMTEPIVNVETDADGNVTGMSGRMIRRMATLGYENMGDAANFGQNPPTLVDEDTVIDDPGVLEKLTTTPAQAKALVEDMLVRAGIDNMAVVAMYLTDDENLGGYDGIVSDAAHYAYELYLCRIVGGIPVAYIEGESMTGGEEAMAKAVENGETVTAEGIEGAYGYGGSWYYEKIHVMVDDTGIISFDWWSPLDIGETVVESAALMPFDDIAANEKQMQIEYETQAVSEYITDMTFSVDHVSLEYQRIAEQDSIESGLLVPVWNFYGTSVTTYNRGDVDESMEVADTYEDGFSEPLSLMTINAVDGSIIDSMQGY